MIIKIGKLNEVIIITLQTRLQNCQKNTAFQKQSGLDSVEFNN